MPADTVNEVLEQEKPQTSDFEQRAMAYIANRKTARELSRTAGEATKGPIEDQRSSEHAGRAHKRWLPRRWDRRLR